MYIAKAVSLSVESQLPIYDSIRGTPKLCCADELRYDYQAMKKGSRQAIAGVKVVQGVVIFPIGHDDNPSGSGAERK
jgi:hypothetical protein